MAKSTTRETRSVSFKAENLRYLDDVLMQETGADRSWCINALIEEHRRRRERNQTAELFPAYEVIRHPERQVATS